MTILNLMLAKLIPAWFLQPALASRALVDLSPEPPCPYGCGAYDVEVKYNGTDLNFDLSQNYGQTYGKCFTECKVGKMASYNSQTRLNNLMNQKACKNVLKGSTKIATGRTEENMDESVFVKLCCTSVPCENKQCQFPTDHKTVLHKVDTESGRVKLRFRFGQGYDGGRLDYQLPSGYCVKDCFSITGGDNSACTNDCSGGVQSLRDHKAISTAESSGTFGTLCCVPMPVPDGEPNIGQREQKTVVNPVSAQVLPDDPAGVATMRVGTLFSSEI